MNISKKEYENAVSNWYELADITMGCDMDNIREVFKNRITNDCGDCIDMNYKNICVTFNADKRMYAEYGGKAILNTKFEYYNKDDVFCGVYDIVGNEY